MSGDVFSPGPALALIEEAQPMECRCALCFGRRLGAMLALVAVRDRVNLASVAAQMEEVAENLVPHFARLRDKAARQ